MKNLKSLIAFSVLGLTSLAGCGGIPDADTDGTVGTTEQAVCSTPTQPIPGCTLIGPVNCSAGNVHYTYLCQTSPYGCQLFTDSTCTWSGHTDGNCSWFQATFCSP